MHEQCAMKTIREIDRSSLIKKTEKLKWSILKMRKNVAKLKHVVDVRNGINFKMCLKGLHNRRNKLEII